MQTIIWLRNFHISHVDKLLFRRSKGPIRSQKFVKAKIDAFVKNRQNYISDCEAINCNIYKFCIPNHKSFVDNAKNYFLPFAVFVIMMVADIYNWSRWNLHASIWYAALHSAWRAKWNSCCDKKLAQDAGTAMTVKTEGPRASFTIQHSRQVYTNVISRGWIQIIRPSYFKMHLRVYLHD